VGAATLKTTLAFPKISIVLTVFNDGQFVDESFGSAIDLRAEVASRELAVDIEIAVFDDGSTDRRTLEVLARLEHRGIQVHRLAHGGVATTRNTAVALLKPEFFIPLDADNRLRPTIITELLPMLLDDEKAGAAYGDAMWFGDRSGRWTMGPIDRVGIRTTNHIDACALVRASAFHEVGGYRTDLLGLEDWDLWLKFLDSERVLLYTPTITFDYRVRAGSLIRQRQNLIYRQSPLPDGAWK
jgi:glycosyltransferase involved in cell wall biosynthesis